MPLENMVTAVNDGSRKNNHCIDEDTGRVAPSYDELAFDLLATDAPAAYRQFAKGTASPEACQQYQYAVGEILRREMVEGDRFEAVLFHLNEYERHAILTPVDVGDLDEQAHIEAIIAVEQRFMLTD